MNFPSRSWDINGPSIDMRAGQIKAMKGKRGEAEKGGLWGGDSLGAREIQTR